MGLCYFNMKNFKEAIPYFKAAIEYATEDKIKKVNNLNLGNSYSAIV